ncbi:MAG TPA: hypothetical protein P5107_07965 [Thermotogota bacterium]|nr:hypothetical protein [Thermotogota bacterium]HRW34976.1 hypothetical protein [Thermotogota bacterium]
MFEKGEKRVQLILFLILFMGLVFLTKAFFLRHSDLFVNHTPVIAFTGSQKQDEQIIVANVFLSYWKPDLNFMESYQPQGFLIEGYGNNQNEDQSENFVSQQVSRQKASFYVNLENDGKVLLSEDAEIVWRIPSAEFYISKFYSLPEIYNVDDIDEVKMIIEKVSQQSILFKNYLSAIDGKERTFYLRNGNVLLVNSWNNLEMFDGEGFIYQMGKGQIYDLYSNGRYFPIIKRGE